MDNKKVILITGSLLHDMGKLLCRYDDVRNHSTTGYEFLRTIPGLSEKKDILDCVRYHHHDTLKDADVAADALCYITYIADNIAAFTDRRESETGESDFIRGMPFESVFNILNGNNDSFSYPPSILSENDDISFPRKESADYPDSFYEQITDSIKEKLQSLEYTYDGLNSLGEVLETYTSYIPSSAQAGELKDISLYNHTKLTAAIASCIYDYLCDKNITDLRQELFENAEKFYEKKSFILFSADISGIQNFIYNISSSGALKGLRSRSFYLEIIMESTVDELLSRLELTRNNVIYTGGGHTYMLLPCTEKTKTVLDGFEKELNKWLIENFGAELYMGTGYSECSANSLRNFPEGSYSEIFGEAKTVISEKKLRRYSAGEIIKLNSSVSGDSERECSVCGRSDRLTEDNGKHICEICSNLKGLSDGIISGEFFTVLSEKEKGSIILPFSKYLVSDSKESLKKRIAEDKNYVRSYSKNKMYPDSSKLWIGDYSKEKDFKKLAENSAGIERIAVLRADVDNLGKAFIAGFDDKYTALSRTSEFSKKLSLFFKHHINGIMRNGKFSVTGKTGERNAAIIYSGGDDVFAVGGWDDIIGFAVDLHNALEKFSQGTLKISAGIGLYSSSYPIYAMAEETGRLEDRSKLNEGKNSVTLFDENNSYSWDEFIKKVMGEKYAALNKFFTANNEKGMSMLYNMLELIRRRDEENRLNIARFAYFISRHAPDEESSTDEQKAAYREFSGKVYSWIQNPEDCRQLITAIYIFIYRSRKKNSDERQEN